MIDLTIQDRRFAGPADTLRARGQDPQTGVLDHLKDRQFRRHRQRDSRAPALNLDRPVAALARCRHRRYRRRHRGRRGGKPFHVQGSGRPRRAARLDGIDQARRPAAVHERRRGRHAQDRGQVEHPELVLGTHPHPVPITRELVEKGHRCPAPPAVVQRPVRARRFGRRHHGQQRGDPDAAGDEHVAGRRPQREVVARPPDMQLGARLGVVVDPGRPTPARRLAKHTDPPRAAVRGRTAQ